MEAALVNMRKKTYGTAKFVVPAKIPNKPTPSPKAEWRGEERCFYIMRQTTQSSLDKMLGRQLTQQMNDADSGHEDKTSTFY